MPCARRFARGPRRRGSELEPPGPDELEERRDKTFGRRVALLTAIYAVVLAFASPEAPAPDVGAARPRIEALAAFAEEEKRYNAQKKDIEKDSKKHERARHQQESRHLLRSRRGVPADARRLPADVLLLGLTVGSARAEPWRSSNGFDTALCSRVAREPDDDEGEAEGAHDGGAGG